MGDKFDLNQGIEGGKYSILKIFHHPEKLRAFKEGRITSPLYVRVKPTNRCNHKCFYCVYDPEFSEIHPSSNRMDEIPESKMEEILDSFAEMGVKVVTFSGGGEPLEYPKIADVFKGTLERGINLSLITNGQNLNGDSGEILASAADWVRVSVDYPDAKLFSRIRNRPESWFYQLKDNLVGFAKQRAAKCDFEANCVVNHYNYDRLVEIAMFCRDIGLDNLRFAPVWKKNFLEYHAQFKDQAMAQIERAEELDGISIGNSYERYFNKNTGGEIRDYPRCFYMEIVPVIAADQNVYTCHNNAYEPGGKVGSIKNKSFKELWFSQETAEFFRNFNPQKVCTHECSNDEKNRLLNEWLACKDEDVVNYI